MDSQKITEQIDACRPDSDDLRSPEMAGLADQINRDPQWQRCYEQSQQVDATLAHLFHDVSVPVDLEKRLLEAIRSADVAPKDGSGPVSDLEIPGAMTGPARQGRKAGGTTRRRFFLRLTGMAACLTVAAVVVAAGYQIWWKVPTETWSAGLLARQSIAWQLASTKATDWREDVASPLADHPLPRSIQGEPSKWRTEEESRLGVSYIVYDLSRPFESSESCLLFVLPDSASVENLPDGPPTHPQASTGGAWAGAWQSGDHIFVLVVKGSKQRYLDQIDFPHDLARLPSFGPLLCAIVKP